MGRDGRHQGLHKLIWLLIYGGLVSLVVAQVLDQAGLGGRLLLSALGALAVALGLILIFVRSRLRDEP